MKKYFLLVTCMTLTMILFCGCGNSNGASSTGSSSAASTQTTSEPQNGNSSEGNSTDSSDKGVVGGAADAVKDVADGVADGVKDVADGVGNTVSGIFGSFDDAQDWFMDQLPQVTEDSRLPTVTRISQNFPVEKQATTSSSTTTIKRATPRSVISISTPAMARCTDPMSTGRHLQSMISLIINR